MSVTPSLQYLAKMSTPLSEFTDVSTLTAGKYPGMPSETRTSVPAIEQWATDSRVYSEYTVATAESGLATPSAADSALAIPLDRIDEIAGSCRIANWDADGALPIQDCTLTAARWFLQEIGRATHLMYLKPQVELDISPEPDGEINLVWYDGSSHVMDLSVGHDLLCFAFRSDGTRRTGRTPLTAKVPEDILAFIRTFYR